MKKLGFIVAVFGVVLALASCKKDDGNTLYLFNWTYYTPDTVLEKFEEKFGCKVKVDTFDSNEVMYAKLKAGASGYDITFPSQDYTSVMIHQGMLRNIDKAAFTNADKINPAVLKMATYDPDMSWSVPYYLGAAGIAVNKTKIAPDFERGWDIFSDTRYAGHMTMLDDMREVMGDALVHLGYSVNSVDGSELREATDYVMNNWKPNLVKFDAEGFGKSFANGDFWICQGYAEVVFGEVPEGKQDEMIDFFIPAEGGPMYLDSMVILKDAKHYDLAMEFINFIHEPEIYAMFLDEFKFPGFINLEAEKLRTTKPMYKAEEMFGGELKNDVGEDLEKYNELWQEIRFTD